MPSRKQIGAFFCSFIAIYVLLVIPWPGMRMGWERFFLGATRSVLSAVLPGLELTSFATGDPQGNPDCARIQIADRSLLREDGSGPVRNLDVDAGAFWRCAALLVALGLSTPVPWRKRLAGLAVCVAIYFLMLFGSIWFVVLRESLSIQPGFERTVWERLIGAVESGLIQQYSIGIPVAVWGLVFLPGMNWVKSQAERKPEAARKGAAKANQ
jgi:hypothetical protein